MHRPGLGTFSSLLDTTFTLIPKTWKTSLFWAGLLFLPSFVVNALSYAGRSVFARGVLPWVALLLQALAAVFVRACVTLQAMNASRGRSGAFLEAGGQAMRRFLPLIGQRLLWGLIFIGICAVAGGVLAAGAAVAVIAEADALSVVVILLAAAGWIAGVLLFWVRYSFSFPAVAAVDATAPQSFALSASLVRGSWWRLLSYRLLFGLMIGFALIIIITPVAFFSMAPALAGIPRGPVFTDLASLERNMEDLQRALWPGLGIAQYLSSVLLAFVGPVFTALLYMEEKRRNAEVRPAEVVIETPREDGGGAP